MKKKKDSPLISPQETADATDIENMEFEQEPAEEEKAPRASARKKFRFSRLFNNNYFVMILSVFCAFVCWVVVSSSASSEEITRIIADVPVDYSLPSSISGDLGLQVINTSTSQTTVNVTITGKKYIVGQITKDDLSASVRLSDVTGTGTYRAEVRAQAIGKLTNFTIYSVDPGYISVRLDRTISKEYSLGIKTNTYQAEEGYTLLQPRLSSLKDTIKITGPTTDLDEIAKVVAITDEIPSVVRETGNYQAKVVLYNANDQVINNPALELEFTEAEVTIVAMQLKTLPVEVTLANAPQGAESISIRLSPSSVQVSGASDVFSTLSSLNVGTIDFSKVNIDHTEFIFDLGAALPSGCSLEDDVTEVKATVNLSGMRTREFDVTNIALADSSHTNAGVRVLTKTIHLTITGPAEQIEGITANDISVAIQLDEEQQSIGKHEIPVTVQINGGDRCWVYGSPTVFVQITGSTSSS